MLSLVGVLAAIFSISPVASAQTTNLARGRPYTLTPRPSYGLTTDAGDDSQLTDGVYTANIPIWTRTSTVGWSNAKPVTIVVDLQSIQPIAGVSYSTAAGTAGVQWPRSVFVLTSDDGQRYFPAGDLAAIPAGEPRPPASGYATFRFSTSDLHTHGRYVAIVVDQDGPFTFCDEIEIAAGDGRWLASPLSGEATTNLQNFFGIARTRVSIQQRLSNDLQDARTALAASHVDDLRRAQLADALDQAAAAIANTPAPDPTSFTATLPLNDLHAGIFGVQGAIAQAEGFPPLSAWVVNPWDFVRPLDKPQRSSAPGMVRIAAMNGETRSGAVNFANSTDQPMTVSLQVTGPLAEADLSDLHLYAVAWTDTRELVPVADALTELPAARTTLDIPAGMTRQLWISYTPQHRAPGVYSGDLEASVDDGLAARVPVELKVFSTTFPTRPSLHLGGWDYTDRQTGLGLTPANTGALIAQLNTLKADSPWATSSVMPAGRFDPSGRLIQLPDTSAFDRWVASWPDARQYCVFVSAQGALGNISITSGAQFATAVGQWITFWAAHAAQLGVQPSQLALLLVDEPHTATQDGEIVAWATAIKAAQPDVRIWENPTFPDPATASPLLLDVSDVAALKRSLMLQRGAPLMEFYQDWATGARTLNVYGASGPARLLDPYTYDRLQAWVCAAVGATGSFFWSFADDAGGTSWNEYAALRTPYSPFFLSRDRVTISKHSEGIREGVEDFEYLMMLRQQVAAVSESNPEYAGLPDALSLHEQAVDVVLRAPGATDLVWASDKDHSAAENMRLMIAESLSLLAANRQKPKRAITVTADALTKTYGDADPPLTYQVTAGTLASGDSLSGSLSRLAGEAVGAHAISSTLANDNYIVTFVPASLTIIARAITVTADAVTKTYGDADPPLTYQVTAGTLASGDSLSGSLSRVAGEAVGAYAISSTLANDNYAITVVGVNLTVTPRALTVTGVAGADREYDGTATATLNLSGARLTGLVGSDVVTLGDSIASFADKTVGSNKPVTISSLRLGGPQAGNYTLTLPSGVTASITPMALTATIAADSKPYDGAATATVHGTLGAGVPDGDAVSLVVRDAAFNNPGIGNGKPVSARLSLTGEDAGNYTVKMTAETTANITAITLTSSFISPLNGATNVDTSQPITWTTVPGVDAYYLYVGTTLGTKNVVNTGELQTTSWQANNVAPGVALYGRLWTKVAGVWRSVDITFTAASSPSLAFTYPASSQTSADLTTQPFAWASIANAQAYYLYVGTKVGASDLVNSGELQATSYLARNLPTGQVVYARLWLKATAHWIYIDKAITPTAPVSGRAPIP